MIRRDPQEIADFFGCYVVQDRDTGSWGLCENKVESGETGWRWYTAGNIIPLSPDIVIAPSDHDWTKLYEPSYSENQPISDNKPDPYYARQADSDNKHQSEVYTHQEYCICMSCNQLDLASEVNGLMKEGWKPQGGLSVEPLKPEYKNDCCLYQAMVRGI